MNRRRPTLKIVTDDARKIMLVKGWKAGDLCREAGKKPIYSGSAKGWVLDLPHLPDVVAVGEWRNYNVKVVPASEAG